MTDRKNLVGPLGIILFAAIGLWATTVAVSFLMVSPTAVAVATNSSLDFQAAARSITHNARVRTMLDLAVVIFQVTGVASLMLGRFVPKSRLALPGRVGFVTAMIGLGIAGTLCAWYGSQFALFSGGSMAVLLNGVILGAGSSPNASVSGLIVEKDSLAMSL
jgi:hypothetical protein